MIDQEGSIQVKKEKKSFKPESLTSPTQKCPSQGEDPPQAAKAGCHGPGPSGPQQADRLEAIKDGADTWHACPDTNWLTAVGGTVLFDYFSLFVLSSSPGFCAN